MGMRAHLDSDFLINIAKIPCVAFGPGDMPRAHTADEWIDVEQIATAAKVYAETDHGGNEIGKLGNMVSGPFNEISLDYMHTEYVLR